MANKQLALCHFEFNKRDLEAACQVLRKKTKDMSLTFKSAEALVLSVPLSTFKRTVRRVYLPGPEQAANLEAWYKKYIMDPLCFVDVSGNKPKTLIRGGEEGLNSFNKTLTIQLGLVHQGLLSGEHTCLGDGRCHVRHGLLTKTRHGDRNKAWRA